MGTITRNIGLSLGADICWPLAFEELVRRMDLAIPWKGDTIKINVERVTIEPFDLRQGCKYDVVLDRLTHWYHPSREWIKKAVVMNDLYVLNNPWSLQSMEKHSTYCAMMRLGLPVPETWLVPPKDYEPVADLKPTLERYARLFDLAHVGEQLGYPMFMKPYDGGAWVGVSKIADLEALRLAYDQSGKRVMHLQRSVEGYDLFTRGIGIGPQVRCVKYDPGAPLHDRYVIARDFMSKDDEQMMRDMTLTINSFFGWDFNSCEALRKDGILHPIDFANACPDSQVTSLHYHWPWLVKAKLRWAVYLAVTKKRFKKNLDWEPYFEIADKGLPLKERLAAFAKLAAAKYETDRFEEFCAKNLKRLDEVADQLFGDDYIKDAIRQKVTALFPRHEVDSFTDLFFERVQQWRREDGAR
jgi:hypothetical protein